MRRRIRRWPALLCACMAGVFLLYLTLWVPGAASNWLGEASVRGAALGAEELTYDDVRREPGLHAGKVVRWHVLSRGESWYYRGDVGRPIEWASAPPTVRTQTGHSSVVIAVVVSPRNVDDFVGEALKGLEDGEEAVFDDAPSRSAGAHSRPAVRLRYKGRG